MAHPRVDLWWWLTRPCPGHKLLFRQPYLLWGVKGDHGSRWEGQHYQNIGSYQMTEVAGGVRFCFQEPAWAALLITHQSNRGSEVILMGDFRWSQPTLEGLCVFQISTTASAKFLPKQMKEDLLMSFLWAFNRIVQSSSANESGPCVIMWHKGWLLVTW